MEPGNVTIHKGDTPQPPDTLRFVVVSDTHARTGTLGRDFVLPAGDILIHCGDFSMRGGEEEVRGFFRELTTWRFRHKIVIAGNHDLTFDPDFCHQNRGFITGLHFAPTLKRDITRYCTYLEDSGLELYGYKIWGTPWIPRHTRTAFSLPENSQELKAKRDLIPADTDILVTHGPVFGFGDLTADQHRAGCLMLLETLERVRPLVHLCGHIHEGHGIYETRACTSVNASICAKKYQPVNCPYVFDLPRRGPKTSS